MNEDRNITITPFTHKNKYSKLISIALKKTGAKVKMINFIKKQKSAIFGDEQQFENNIDPRYVTVDRIIGAKTICPTGFKWARKV